MGPSAGQTARDKMPLILTAMVLAIVVAFLCSSTATVLHLFPDDAFFYIKTANNFARGLGPTFDGVNRTNGFHPLYFLLLAGIATVVPLTGREGLVVPLVLDNLLSLIGLICLNRLLRRHGVSFLSRLMVSLLVLFFTGFNDIGVESHLVLALLGAYLLVLDRPVHSAMSIVALAVLGILLCMSRLEMHIFVLLAVIVCVTLPACQRKTWGAAAGATAGGIAPPLMALAAYAALNLVWFGHPTSVSSWLKVGFPGTFNPETNWLPHASIGFKGRFLFFGAVSLITVPVCLKRILAHGSDVSRVRLSLIFLALSLYSLAYAISMLLLSRGAVAGWYCSIPLTAAFAACAIAWDGWACPRLKQRISPRVEQAANILLVLLILITGTVFLARKFTVFTDENRVNLALWMKQHLPANARIFMVDVSGLTGYFSERSVIDGDGLINSFEYRDYLCSGRLKQYLLDKHVNYLAANRYNGADELVIRVVLWIRRPQRWVFEHHPKMLARFGTYAVFQLTPKDIENSYMAGPVLP